MNLNIYMDFFSAFLLRIMNIKIVLYRADMVTQGFKLK